ncbi:hypothetical protein [Streptomyces sp. NPDC001815]|uniref:hypothetical protein n=1 Tax=Streptomyces sp. NPDC001815 TaxID=3154526 RepID=UPI00331FE106
MAIFRTWTRTGVMTRAAVAFGLAVAAVPSASAASPSPEAAPAQLYVASWGKDTWPGTLKQPFATPARAAGRTPAHTRHDVGPGGQPPQR